jgi:hypothetical protein
MLALEPLHQPPRDFLSTTHEITSKVCLWPFLRAPNTWKSCLFLIYYQPDKLSVTENLENLHSPRNIFSLIKKCPIIHEESHNLRPFPSWLKEYMADIYSHGK